MQLFIIDKPIIDWKKITLHDAWIVHQLWRVLRSRIWDSCFLQWVYGNEIVRTKVVFEEISKKEILCKIISQETKEIQSWSHRIAIARPNKSSKMELIVQKLTEIWVDEIIFFKAERSQPWVWNEKKWTRIQTVVKEATEQCWGWSSPVISYCTSLNEISCEKAVVTDIPWRLEWSFDGIFWWDELVFVWPEWGRGDNDYEYFATKNTTVLEMGDRVLRMETAAIIVAGKLMGI